MLVKITFHCSLFFKKAGIPKSKTLATATHSTVDHGRKEGPALPGLATSLSAELLLPS